MQRNRWTSRVVAGVALVLLTGCGPSAGDPAPGPAGPGPASPATAAPDRPATTPAAATTRALAVYYVAQTPAGYRLYREFHRVPTSDPASDAVREMLGRPTGLDPDYATHWPAGTALRSPVTTGGGVITVDLTGPTTGAQLGTELADISVQQLVYTVQAALQSTDPVRLLHDGRPVAELFGAVATADPVRRADPYAVRSLVQIDDPANGVRVGSPVVVSGEAAVFEATVVWQVRRGGQVVTSGVTQSAEGQRFAPYRFTVALPPGEYEIVVTEDDPSDGAGRPPLTDSKTVTVTG